MNSSPYTPEPPASPQQALKLLPAITGLRLRYLRFGYTPLPCVGKAPALPNWPEARIDAAQIRAWPMLFPNALNISIRTRYNPAADIDVYDADLACTVERALLKYLPQDKLILRRVGIAPKRLIPFCCLTPFPKCAIAFKSPDGKTHRVEVLADGQQYIAEGWHPDSGEPYGWMGEKLSDVLPTKLPVLTQDIARKFLADVSAIVADKGWTITNRNDEKPKAEQPRTHGGNGVNRQTRNTAYARAALDRECEAVANAAKGCRNNTLNAAAFSLFQLVAGGELDEGEAVSRLTAAATECGLMDDDGAKSVEKTIASGAKAGLREPRCAPENDDEPRDHGPPKGDGSHEEQAGAGINGSAGDGGHTSATPGARRVELVPASHFEQRPIDWIW